MVEGITSEPLTITSASGPQHEQETGGLTEEKSNKKHPYSAPDNISKEDNRSHKQIREKSKTEFRRNGENHNENRHYRQQQYNYFAPYDSPFISPPITRKRRPNGSEKQRQSQNPQSTTRSIGSHFVSQPIRDNAIDMKYTKPKPQPLVLDPSARSFPGQLGSCNSEHRRVTISPLGTESSVSRGGNSTVRQLFQVATKGILEHHATAAQYSTSNSFVNDIANARGYLHATPVAIDAAHGSTASSAAVFARSNGVVQAGFLHKLGKNIPEFKRRFFVLKPETNLYYYLSPNDTEPRGKIDLEGSAVEEVEKYPDGRFRFMVSLKSEFGSDCDKGDETENIVNQQKQQQIVLEARSAEIGKRWIRHIREESVSFLKEKNETLTDTVATQSTQIADLERQIKQFKMIEADRDGALEDAKDWKNKFNRLDEALRLLTQQIRKSLTAPLIKEPDKSKDDDANDNNDSNEIQDVHDENRKSSDFVDTDKKDLDRTHSMSSNDECRDDPVNIRKPITSKSNQAPALLDNLTHEDMDVEEIMDVPGTYFSGLSNACKQQQESSRLASVEASSAVEDVLQANKQVEVVQKRMHKAEKQILKLWEENCDTRKALKQKKREKRVLVKEVRQLQETVQELKKNIMQSQRADVGYEKLSNEDGPMADSMIGSDEERLIIELEEHVASSIRLHERLLAGTDFDRETEQSISIELASSNLDALEAFPSGGKSRFENSELERSKAKLLSLFDNESDSDSDESTLQQLDSENRNIRIESQSPIRSITSSVEFEDNAQLMDAKRLSSSISLVDSDVHSPSRVNPLLALDDEKSEDEFKRDSNSAKPSSTKLITENGRATSKLVCPLMDVVDVRGRSKLGNGVDSIQHDGNEDLHVYHLTFYSQKIGLQFQKTPPAHSKSRGLLTDAVTADLVETKTDRNSTAAELKSVASITSLSKGGTVRPKKESQCSHIPKDIVLVCGFEGFDDSGSNQRPKLGARLVAFDGVSVEVGKWTFESIKKAIKSRGRPLTLSFRNDFLNTEQRSTLTKAVRDVNAKSVPVNPIINSKQADSTIQSLVAGENGSESLNTSMVAIEKANCWNRYAASSKSSLSSDVKNNRTSQVPVPSSSQSVSSHKSTNSVISAASSASSFMSIFVKKPPIHQELKNGDQQLLGDSRSVDSRSEHGRIFGSGINPVGTKQHQNFQANLL